MTPKTSFVTTFSYQGKEYPLSIDQYWVIANPKGLESKGIFAVMVNNFFAGHIRRDEDGTWIPLDKKMNQSKLPFVLEEKHYQRLGGIIEKELAELV